VKIRGAIVGGAIQMKRGKSIRWDFGGSDE
jgi:hypothetical protein